MFDQWAFRIYGAHLWRGVVDGRDGYAVELTEVVGGGFGYAVGMAAGLVEAAGGGFGYAVRWRRGWWRRVVDFVMWWRWRWSFMPLLAEDIQVVLHLCEPRSLPIDVLPVSFDALHCSLPSQDGFLFLPEPLILPLESSELLFLCCCCLFFNFLIPIIDLDVIKVCIPWKRVYWRRYPRK
jgi:hypothetical protein